MEEESNHPFDESTFNSNNDTNTTDITNINIEPSKAGVGMIEYLKYLNEDDWSSDGDSSMRMASMTMEAITPLVRMASMMTENIGDTRILIMMVSIVLMKRNTIVPNLIVMTIQIWLCHPKKCRLPTIKKICIQIILVFIRMMILFIATT